VLIDARWQELARILVNYSTRVRPGERVLLTMMEEETLPLVRAVFTEVVRAGGYPLVEFQSVHLERELMVLGSASQVGWVPEWLEQGMEWADVYIGLRGAANPHAFEGIPAERIAVRRRAMGIISTLRNEKTRWVLARVPTAAMAQQAGLSFDKLADLYFGAVLRDWHQEAQRYAMVKGLFEGANEVRLLGPGTDLRFKVSDRLWEVEDGRINMPGGELYTAPHEESAEGTIQLSFPGVFAGRLVNGVTLRFADGEVVEARAESEIELLRSLLAMDQGARRIGEFGVGLNAGLGRFCADPLLDEKMLGTFHIALGRSYASCGGKNLSALHWDLVTDFRSAGEVRVDSRTVFAGGCFLGL
jgi:aminopeptidase